MYPVAVMVFMLRFAVASLVFVPAFDWIAESIQDRLRLIQNRTRTSTV
jgi:hypothetical protein